MEVGTESAIATAKSALATIVTLHVIHAFSRWVDIDSAPKTPQREWNLVTKKSERSSNNHGARRSPTSHLVGHGSAFRSSRPRSVLLSPCQDVWESFTSTITRAITCVCGTYPIKVLVVIQ